MGVSTGGNREKRDLQLSKRLPRRTSNANSTNCTTLLPLPILPYHYLHRATSPLPSSRSTPQIAPTSFNPSTSSNSPFLLSLPPPLLFALLLLQNPFSSPRRSGTPPQPVASPDTRYEGGSADLPRTRNGLLSPDNPYPWDGYQGRF
ncbi:uncharacterized protein RAG0_01588 [Rhynchosporium agropyri]|uniref:Uncharacterized protein n=1 Tax=Rhynchosporium agropyri TaxID=914238 RepID=A0A1E1JXD2_9HELO|nr:uncharacterized protein RAG0_01588 [Rhynchosporium agropyri]